MTAISLLLLALLVAAHLFSGRLRFLQGTPRSGWLSFAGGVSVGYVFVDLLPELSENQAALREGLQAGFALRDQAAYLVAALGLLVFYGLDHLTKTSRRRNREAGRKDAASSGAFWVQISSFTVYNALIGYLLLHRPASGVAPMVFFGVAMALHFVVNDYGLREDHKDLYTRYGCWLAAGGVVLGWLIGAAREVPEALIAFMSAFIAGGTLMNVFKEELPEARQSRFMPFLLGAAGFGALLLLA